MGSLIYLSLWEVIGIVSGVFFFLMFLLALASYLHQLYSNDIQFNTIDDSESGCNIDYSEGEIKSFVQYYYDKIVDKINDFKKSISKKPSSKKKKTKKKPKKKVKVSLSDDYINNEDEETGNATCTQPLNKNPSKTQHLYAGSSSKVTGYTSSSTDTSTAGNSNETTLPPPRRTRINLSAINSNSNSSSSSSNSTRHNKSSTSSVDKSSEQKDTMDLSTSFSGRAVRKHPSQVIV
jgi:hypothetical protein